MTERKDREDEKAADDSFLSKHYWITKAKKLFLKIATTREQIYRLYLCFFLLVARMWSILKIVAALVRIFPEQSSSAPPAGGQEQVMLLCSVLFFNLKQNKIFQQLDALSIYLWTFLERLYSKDIKNYLTDTGNFLSCYIWRNIRQILTRCQVSHCLGLFLCLFSFNSEWAWWLRSFSP